MGLCMQTCSCSRLRAFQFFLHIFNLSDLFFFLAGSLRGVNECKKMFSLTQITGSSLPELGDLE